MTLPFKLRKSAGIPVTPAVYRMLVTANRARDRRDWTLAADLYGRALAADPGLAHIWVQRGHALREMGEMAEARAAYQKAIELTPSASDPHLHLGHLHKQSGDRAAATRAYLEAARLDPGNSDALQELYNLLDWEDGDMPEAVRAVLDSRVAACPEEEPAPADVHAARLRQAVDDLADRLRRDGADPAALQALSAAAGALADLSAEPPAEAGTGIALVFDVSDLISYFRNARLPTGIQRVQIETISAALEGARGGVQICAFQERRDDWLEIPAPLFRHLCRLSLANGNRAAEDWIAALTRLRLHLATAAPLVFPKGAVLINLGTSWWLQNYFLFVRQAKARFDIRYVPFVHDLIPVMASEHCTRELTQDFISWAIGAFDHADFFLANSEATKRDLLRVAAFLGHDLPPENVAVVRLDAEFRKPGLTPAPASRLGALGLRPSQFVLFVSTIESRKNHLGAFEAWIQLLRQHGAGRVPKLVCVGNRGWLNDAVYARLDSHAGLRDKVVMLSGLSDADLDLLYRNCLFTLYPSNYEGWGLPVTESLCYGKVPLVSNTSSLPEAGGEFAVYFEAGSVQRLSRALEELIFDTDARHRQEEKIRDAFKPRSWRDVAEQIRAEIAHWLLCTPAHTRSGTPALAARPGAYYSLSRNQETRIWPGMRSAEVFRADDGWWGPDDWGCWTKPQGGRLAIPLAEADQPLRLYLNLQGLPEQRCGYEIVVEATGERFRGEVAGDASRWVCIDVSAAPADRILGLRIAGQRIADLRPLTGGLDRRTVSVGLRGFFLCARSDLVARADFLEAVALDTLEELAFDRAGRIADLSLTEG